MLFVWFILPFWVCLLADNRGITDTIPLFFLQDVFGTQPTPLPARVRVGLEAGGSIAHWSRDLDPGLRVQVLPRPSLPVCPWPARVHLSVFIRPGGEMPQQPVPVGGN